MPGAGRKLTDEVLDVQLFEWVQQHREAKTRVSRRLIKNKAKELFGSADRLNDFKVSKKILLIYNNFRQAKAGWTNF